MPRSLAWGPRRSLLAGVEERKGVLSNRSVMLARVIRKRRLVPVETDRA